MPRMHRYCHGDQSFMFWSALNGAQPIHLEPSFRERCDFAGLRHVTPAWPLKSVYIEAYAGDGSIEPPGVPMPSFPVAYSTIECLVLKYADDKRLYFYPEGGALNLRSLSVLQHNALVTFANTVRCNPRLRNTLTSVTIASHDTSESQGREDVKTTHAFLREAKALVRLELVMNDTHFQYYPSSIEKATWKSWQEDPDRDSEEEDTDSEDSEHGDRII